jgi:hypothetical protein
MILLKRRPGFWTLGLGWPRLPPVVFADLYLLSVFFLSSAISDPSFLY